MNTLLHAGQSHPFATADELLALPIVRKYVEDPQVGYLGFDQRNLVAFVGKPAVMHLIGTLERPVVLPKSIHSGDLK